MHAWRDAIGSWPALAEELARRAGDAVELPPDLGSIERGLRRLADRGQRGGGQYGRWMVRYLGVPERVEAWVRWLGQYHTRFADLPLSLRRRQLALWDRPPMSESAAGAWIDLGVASVAMRERDRALVDARLGRAGLAATRAGRSTRIEHALFAARVASDDAAWELEAELLARVEALLGDSPGIGAHDAACYLARLRDARAHRVLHPPAGARDVDRARAIYASIPGDTAIPFVDFRRALGLAYCARESGDRQGGVALAIAAAEHAADGGLVRFRAMALNLASRSASGAEAGRYREHARRLSVLLEDEDLRSRVDR